MKIAIIGGGNIGGSIARGLAQDATNTYSISVSDPNPKTLQNLKSYSSNISTCNSNSEAIVGADIIVIAVKPWLVESIAGDISNSIDYTKSIVASVAAGIDLQQLKKFFSEKATIFRLIPNTAMEVQQSLTVISSYNASKEKEQLILDIFNRLGKTILSSESLINAYMSLSSCGIAYAFRYIRAAMEGAVELGIRPTDAQAVILQTLRGAVELLEANNSHPEAEIDKVTTPGGFTIKGLNEMEANGFTNAVIKGLKASFIK